MNRPLVLIIDDEPDIRELLEITLARMDIDSRSAATVEQAMQQLAAASYRLILVDMRLPDGSGIEFAKQLSGDAKMNGIPVIMTTGRSGWRRSWRRHFGSRSASWRVRPDLMMRRRRVSARRTWSWRRP